MISAGTVEERIVERAEKKLYLDQMVNRGTSNRQMDEEAAANVSTSELLASLKFGSNAVFNSTNEMPSMKDIDKMTDRTRSEECSDGLLTGGLANTASDFDKDKVSLFLLFPNCNITSIFTHVPRGSPLGTHGHEELLWGRLPKAKGRKGRQNEGTQKGFPRQVEAGLEAGSDW